MKVVQSRQGLTSSSIIYHCSSLFFLCTAHSTHRAVSCIPKLNKGKVLRKKLTLMLLFHRWGELKRLESEPS